VTNSAIIAFSGLLIFSYVLDIVGRRFRLPSVILLLVTGIAARQLLDRLDVHLTWVNALVPVVGTLGLILIVLEGALDLTLRRERMTLVARSATAAVLGFAACMAVLAALFHYSLGLGAPVAALAAIPFAVISSAVAIPSAAGLGRDPREFVTYESSISDIIGVLVFYAWLGSGGEPVAFLGDLFGGGAISLLVAAAAALGLLHLINRIEGHVRFLPLLAGMMLIYGIGKELHLTPLVLVFVCGLLLNNPQLLGRAPWLGKLLRDGYEDTLKEFKGLVAELTFAVRSFFFLMLGYWTETRHMVSPQAWAIAAAVVVVVYASRFAILGVLRQDESRRLLWLAPRGLITVLLFLAAMETGTLESFPFGAVMLVVLSTAALTGLAHRGSVTEVAGALDSAGNAASERVAE
jgi:cell volume regulation protein A